MRRSCPGSGQGLFLCLLFLASPATSQAREPGTEHISPLPVRNFHPVQLVFPAPSIEDPFLVGAGRLEWSLGLAESNTLNRVSRDLGRTGILFDLETSRAALSVRYGLSERWELQLSLPFMKRWGGVLDRPIEVVERATGQLNPLRETRPRNDFRFRFRRQGADIFSFGAANQSGLGDVSLGVRALAWESEDRRARVVLGGLVEMPTGREEELFGNGGVDLALSALGLWRKERVSWLAQLSVVAPADLFASSGIESDPYLTAGVGVVFALNRRVSLLAQLDYYGSPLGGTSVLELERALWEIAAGVNIRLGQDWLWQIGLVENLVVEPGADLSLVSSFVFRP